MTFKARVQSAASDASRKSPASSSATGKTVTVIVFARSAHHVDSKLRADFTAQSMSELSKDDWQHDINSKLR